MLELSPAEWTAVALSLRIALVATAWALPFGIAIGWLLARGEFWGKTVLDGLVHLPLVLPPVVTGYLLLMWFGRKGPIGAFLYAAATLGANPALVFFTVTLPLALPGIVAGVLLCFARALGEFGATITFVSNIPGETQTISAAIYTFLQIPDGDASAGRLVVVAIVLSLAALIPAEWLGRRASARFHGE